MGVEMVQERCQRGATARFAAADCEGNQRRLSSDSGGSPVSFQKTDTALASMRARSAQAAVVRSKASGSPTYPVSCLTAMIPAPCSAGRSKHSKMSTVVGHRLARCLGLEMGPPLVQSGTLPEGRPGHG